MANALHDSRTRSQLTLPDQILRLPLHSPLKDARIAARNHTHPNLHDIHSLPPQLIEGNTQGGEDEDELLLSPKRPIQPHTKRSASPAILNETNDSREFKRAKLDSDTIGGKIDGKHQSESEVLDRVGQAVNSSEDPAFSAPEPTFPTSQTLPSIDFTQLPSSPNKSPTFKMRILNKSEFAKEKATLDPIPNKAEKEIPESNKSEPIPAIPTTSHPNPTIPTVVIIPTISQPIHSTPQKCIIPLAITSPLTPVPDTPAPIAAHAISESNNDEFSSNAHPKPNIPLLSSKPVEQSRIPRPSTSSNLAPPLKVKPINRPTRSTSKKDIPVAGPSKHPDVNSFLMDNAQKRASLQKGKGKAKMEVASQKISPSESLRKLGGLKAKMRGREKPPKPKPVIKVPSSDEDDGGVVMKDASPISGSKGIEEKEDVMEGIVIASLSDVIATVPSNEVPEVAFPVQSTSHGGNGIALSSHVKEDSLFTAVVDPTIPVLSSEPIPTYEQAGQLHEVPVSSIPAPTLLTATETVVSLQESMTDKGSQDPLLIRSDDVPIGDGVIKEPQFLPKKTKASKPQIPKRQPSGLALNGTRRITRSTSIKKQDVDKVTGKFSQDVKDSKHSTTLNAPVTPTRNRSVSSPTKLQSVVPLASSSKVPMDNDRVPTASLSGLLPNGEIEVLEPSVPLLAPHSGNTPDASSSSKALLGDSRRTDSPLSDLSSDTERDKETPVFPESTLPSDMGTENNLTSPPLSELSSDVAPAVPLKPKVTMSSFARPTLASLAKSPAKATRASPKKDAPFKIARSQSSVTDVRKSFHRQSIYKKPSASLANIKEAIERLNRPVPQRPSTSLGFSHNVSDSTVDPSRSVPDKQTKKSTFGMGPPPVPLRRAVTIGNIGKGGMSAARPFKSTSHGLFMRGPRAPKVSKNPTLPSVLGSPVKGGSQSYVMAEPSTSTATNNTPTEPLESIFLTEEDMDEEELSTWNKGKARLRDPLNFGWEKNASRRASTASQALTESINALRAEKEAFELEKEKERERERQASESAEESHAPRRGGLRSATIPSSSGSATNSSPDPAPKHKPKPPPTLSTLKGCKVFVDVKDSHGADAGTLFKEMLQGLGARVLHSVGQTCTHIVFKNGMQGTINRYRALDDPKPKVVQMAWVVTCAETNTHVEEEAFEVDLLGMNIAGIQKRRRSSMIPQLIFPDQDEEEAANGDVSMSDSNSSFATDDMTPLELARRRWQ